MDNFIEVNVIQYVKHGIESGRMIPRQAEKFARIMARQGNVGENVISWSADSLGNEIMEKVASVQVDEQTNQPGWIVSKVNNEGNVIIDNNGHINEWIIDDTTFKKKYEIDPDNPLLYKAKGQPQLFVQIPDNIILNQWGSLMQIAAGGYINITNVNDMYGISKRDFEDTYRFTDEVPTKGTTR